VVPVAANGPALAAVEGQGVGMEHAEGAHVPGPAVGGQGRLDPEAVVGGVEDAELPASGLGLDPSGALREIDSSARPRS
jgi:hypothetical protein